MFSQTKELQDGLNRNTEEGTLLYGCRLADVVSVYMQLCVHTLEGLRLCSSMYFCSFFYMQTCMLLVLHTATVFILHCARMHLCIYAFMFIPCVCVCWGRRQASRFHTQSGSISSGRPQSRPPRGRLPTVGTSRDDCPRWGDCTCALTYIHAHSHTNRHILAHTDLHIPMYVQTCIKIHIHT